jgi:hypothetical protein
MRTKNAWFFLATLVVFTLGCHNQSPAPSPNQSEKTGVFDIAPAMRMFYGNYDVKKQASITLLPKEKSSLPAAGEEEMTVRMLFSSFIGDAGTQTLVLLTYAVPSEDETYYCHACAPTIGMAVFSQHGPNWTMDASNRSVTAAGEFGKPPTDIHLVQIGPDHRAVKIIDIGEGNGETTSVLQLLIPWNGTVNLGLERIVADDDKGLCDSRGGLACYANRRTVTFIPKDDGEYYDLELKLTGTDLPTSDTTTSMRARKVNGLETLKFENGKYLQVSRQGDRTYVDDAVARREDLK